MHGRLAVEAGRSRVGLRFLIVLQLALLVFAAAFTISAEAGSFEVKYHDDVWPGENKVGIKFLSPMKGWVGISNWLMGNHKPVQSYLLATNSGPEHMQPVPNLKLPVNYGSSG